MNAGSAKATVLKLGGELLEQPDRLRALASRLAQTARLRPLIVVHGGGREIDAALAQAGIETRQVEGLRITDAATLQVVVSVLAGLVNTRLVAAINSAGAPAVGLTGADAGIVCVEPASAHVTSTGQRVDLGLVGRPIDTIRPALLEDLCSRGYVPVIASIGLGRDGELFNVNADTLAASLGARLHVPRLVMAGATAGVLDRRGATVPVLDLDEVARMIGDGGATAGMVAKLNACREAIAGGVEEVLVIDGRDVDVVAAAIALEGPTLITGGTRITGSVQAIGR